MKITMEQLTHYAKNYGFVFQGSELYGGLANTWDYGPLGVTLKNNIKALWWKRFVQESPVNVGLDSAILMNPKTWEASGHLSGFNDPLIDCKACKARHRVDHLIDAFDRTISADGLSIERLQEIIDGSTIKCPACGVRDFTPIRQFNLMFKTSQGALDDHSHDIYLRPETAQGIFLNFKNVLRTSRKKIPFGIAQIGKSFRNEITPGNFIFRTREFEQCELEFFCEPGTEMDWFNYWKKASMQFLLDLNIPQDHLNFSDHAPEKLSHYSNATSDIEYQFAWGFDELWGIASRTDYDLKQHQAHSGESLEYMDPMTNQKYLPYVIEPSLGVERLFLALLTEAYEEETLDNGDIRTVLKIHPALAPYKVAILPLIKKRHAAQAQTLFETLSKHVTCSYDDTGNIGRRYRRCDAIGTPFAITIDDDSLNKGTYTLRMRDTMAQITLSEPQLIEYIQKHTAF